MLICTIDMNCLSHIDVAGAHERWTVRALVNRVLGPNVAFVIFKARNFQTSRFFFFEIIQTSRLSIEPLGATKSRFMYFKKKVGSSKDLTNRRSYLRSVLMGFMESFIILNITNFADMLRREKYRV